MFSIFTSVPSNGTSEAKKSEAPVAVSVVTKKASVAARAAGVVGITLGKKKRAKKKKKDSDVALVWNGLSETVPMRISPLVDNQPYKVVQESYQSAAFATSTSINSFQSFTFAVFAMPDISSLTSLFDQYMLAEVEFWLIPQMTASTATGELATVADYDDSANLSTFNAALGYQNCRVSSPLTGHYRKIQPHVALAAYAGTFTSYANACGVWIDAGSPSVYHYGIKSAATPTNVSITYDIIVRYTTYWRNLR